MKRFLLAALLLCALSGYADAAILVMSTNGTYTTKTTLEVARTALDAAGKTVVVTTALTAAQSNITAAWPADRALKVEKGGSIANSMAFTINGPFSAGDYQAFSGTGAVTGLKEVKPDWWAMNTTPGTTDMTAAVQKAITCAIASDGGVKLTSGLYLLTSSVNIDRAVDGALFDKYFTISSSNDSGFVVGTAINMFSSSIAFTTAPVSQLVKFSGVTFSSTDSSLAAYVLYDSRFLRSRFEGCNFQKIKLMLATIYTQSLTLENCNIRRFTGVFFNSPVRNYDLKVTNNVIEAGTGDAFDLGIPTGGTFTGNLIEGMTGTAIEFNGAEGLTIHGNYFESNGLDLDASGVNVAYGVSVQGNYFSNSTATYTVKWGQVLGSISAGNWHTGYMHNFTSAVRDIAINDIAQNGLSNIANTPIIKTGHNSTFTATLTGCTTTPTGTARYSKTGSTVTIYFPQINGTSNTTAATLTGMPVDIRPTRQQIVSMRTTDSGAITFGIGIIDTDGTIYLGKDATGNGFTGSGTKGIEVFTITYSLL